MTWKLRPTRGALLVTFLALAFTGAARTAGAGWLMVLVAICAALLAVGLVGPLLAMRGVRVSLQLPPDAVAGASVNARLTLVRPASPALVTVAGFGPPVAVFGSGAHEGRLVAPGRGVVAGVDVEVSCAAPIGLAWVHRIFRPPTEAHVGPMPRAAAVPVEPATASAADGALDRGSDGEGVGGVREYRRGDPLKRIHWVSTARYGELHVREFHQLEHPGVDIVVTLLGTPDQQEARASEAAGQALAALRADVPVRLHTIEASGAVSGVVTTRLDVSRRLARAISGVRSGSDAMVTT